jgi:hypothetical protein
MAWRFRAFVCSEGPTPVGHAWYHSRTSPCGVRKYDLAANEADPDGGRVYAPHRLEQCRGIDALEFTRGGEQVVLGARGPNIGPEEELLGQIFNVFTLRDGRIVRIDDYRGRNEALDAAGVAGDVGWR